VAAPTDAARETGPGLPGPSPRRPTRARAAGRLVLAGLAALAVGLVIGRGALFSPSPAAAPPAPAPQTTAELVTALERRVERDPQDLSALQQLGAAYTRRALETSDPAFYALASSAYERARDVDPEHPVTTVGEGNLALALHDFDRALTLGEQAVDALRRNEQALGVLVDAQVELGRYDDAAETLQAMLDRNPALPALARTSYLRQLHGDLPGAIQAMTQAATVGAAQPIDAAVVHALIGDLRLEGGDLDDAAEAYARAAELAPDLVGAQVGAARVAAARGDVDDAVPRLERLTDRVPAPAALTLLAELHHAAGRSDAAEDTAELVRANAALQEAAGQVVDLEMALFEADLGDPQEAVRLARRAYDARPDNVFAADALAWALHRAGRSDEALPLIEQALRLDTVSGQLRGHAAAVFAANGRIDDARAQLQRVADGNRWFSFVVADDLSALADELGVVWA
jgi:tetratricopeptide (TPR) repeat protein